MSVHAGTCPPPKACRPPSQTVSSRDADLSVLITAQRFRDRRPIAGEDYPVLRISTNRQASSVPPSVWALIRRRSHRSWHSECPIPLHAYKQEQEQDDPRHRCDRPSGRGGIAAPEREGVFVSRSDAGSRKPEGATYRRKRHRSRA